MAQLVKAKSVEEFMSNIIFSPVKTSQFNNNKTINLSYQNPGATCKILLQTPRMRMPFGTSKFDSDGVVKYTIQLEFVAGSLFHEIMKALDKKILEVVQANQRVCLGTSDKNTDFIAARGYTIVKESLSGWPDSFRPKLEVRQGKWQGMAVDENRRAVDWEEIKAGEAVGIVELGPIWFVAGKFGVKVVLHQIKVWPATSMTELMIEEDENESPQLELQFSP